jgi:hypothetical protein
LQFLTLPLTLVAHIDHQVLAVAVVVVVALAAEITKISNNDNDYTNLQN